jgi:hypothetical protein
MPVTKPGNYSVFVPYGEGGFISSEKYVVTAISNPCLYVSPQSKKDVTKEKKKLHPKQRP